MAPHEPRDGTYWIDNDMVEYDSLAEALALSMDPRCLTEVRPDGTSKLIYPYDMMGMGGTNNFLNNYPPSADQSPTPNDDHTQTNSVSPNNPDDDHTTSQTPRKGRRTPEVPAMNERDTPEVRLGMADLVDAVIELNHHASTPQLERYLLERIELLRLELGVAPGWLDDLLRADTFSDPAQEQGRWRPSFGSKMPYPFETISLPGMEAPRELAQRFRDIQGRARQLTDSINQLFDEVIALRRAWITAVLLDVEPALEYRATTETRLQQRGLPPRPTPPPADPFWGD